MRTVAERTVSEGFVYILTSPNSPYIKIGGTEHPPAVRLRSINSGSAYEAHGPWTGLPLITIPSPKLEPGRAWHGSLALGRSGLGFTTAPVALICGPPRMMEVAADALLEAGVPRTSVLYERFDYGAGKGRLDRARRRHALLLFLVIIAGITAFSLR